MHLTFYQKLKGFFYPVHLRSGTTALNPVLELFYFRGRYQLATTDALYSDGSRYRPLIAAFRALRKDFPKLKKVLVLGTGLGSAVHVAYSMGFLPAFTLVDLDNTILEWAEELMPPEHAKNAAFVCADAGAFIALSADRYDLIIIDVFMGREVPGFTLAEPFLNNCKAHLSAGGRVVMNYMLPQDGINRAKPELAKVFGEMKEMAFGLNRVYISKGGLSA